MAKKDEKEQVNEKETKYSKKQLVSSKKYASNRDLLQVLLQDNITYTLKEVDKKIEDFKKRKV